MKNFLGVSKAQVAHQCPSLQFSISQQFKSHFESRFFIHVEQADSIRNGGLRAVGRTRVWRHPSGRGLPSQEFPGFRL
jgi:hypothetical protein